MGRMHNHCEDDEDQSASAATGGCTRSRESWDSGAANKFLGGGEGGPTTYFVTGGSTEAEPAVKPEED